MFKTADELKQFLTWAKDQQIVRVEVGDVKVEFSPLAAIKESMLQDLENGSASTLADSEPSTKKDDDEDLYWSSNN